MRLSKSEKKAAKRASAMDAARIVRRRYMGDYFLSFSCFLRPWLAELSERYQDSGLFPTHPMFLLPAYYDDEQDREIACFAALLLNTDGDVFARVGIFRDMLGESPRRWFSEREFVLLSVGSSQNFRTAGVENWRIARLFGVLHEHSAPYLNSSGGLWLHRTFLHFARELRCSILDSLFFVLSDYFVRERDLKMRMLLLVLSSRGRLGQSLWPVGGFDEVCPVTPGLIEFLRTWFPDYRRWGSADAVVPLFGLGGFDFFYAHLAWEELQRRNSQGCSRLATSYRNWYDGGRVLGEKYWRGEKGILPPIVFQD